MDYFLWEFTRGLYYSHGDVEFASKHEQFYNSNSFLKKFILSIYQIKLNVDPKKQKISRMNGKMNKAIILTRKIFII